MSREVGVVHGRLVVLQCSDAAGCWWGAEVVLSQWGRELAVVPERGGGGRRELTWLMDGL